MTPKICLDAGHGLYTAGKQTPDGIKEWTLNDRVCDEIEKILASYDCEILRTDNNEGQTDESLSSRVNAYVRAGCDAVVSIHHNAYTGTWNSASGVEVYTDRSPTKKDIELAHLIYDRLTASVGNKGRGVKKANFAIINQNKIPAVLVEGGFMDSTTDYKVITSAEGQYFYALAVAQALIEFLKLTPKKSVKKSMTYHAHEVKSGRWLPAVKSNNDDYAGNFGKAIDAVLINSDDKERDFFYRVHEAKSDRWLPGVKNNDDYAGNFGKAIDAVMIRVTKGKLRYRVHEVKSGRWLPFVTGYNVNDASNGYAGNFGNEIDAVQIIYEE